MQELYLSAPARNFQKQEQMLKNHSLSSKVKCKVNLKVKWKVNLKMKLTLILEVPELLWLIHCCSTLSAAYALSSG